MTIVLYYTPASGACRAVLLTVKLLGLDVNLKQLNLLEKEQLAPEFVKLNPQHTVPTLVDNGFVIWESYAIITYLVQLYDKSDSLYPKDPRKKAIVDQRLYFDMGTLLKSFADYYYPMLLHKASPDPVKYSKVEDAFKFLEGFLEGHEYVAGDSLTVADVSLVSTVSNFDWAEFDVNAYKNVSRWYAKVKAALPEYEAISGKDVLTRMFEAYFQKSNIQVPPQSTKILH